MCCHHLFSSNRGMESTAIFRQAALGCSQLYQLISTSWWTEISKRAYVISHIKFTITQEKQGQTVFQLHSSCPFSQYGVSATHTPWLQKHSQAAKITFVSRKCASTGLCAQTNSNTLLLVCTLQCQPLPSQSSVVPVQTFSELLNEWKTISILVYQCNEH